MFNLEAEGNNNNSNNEGIENNKQEGNLNSDYLGKLKEAYTNAIESQKNGDWAKYGEYINQIGKLIDELSK